MLDTAAQPVPSTSELRSVMDRVQALLDKHSPGEKLSWPVTAGPQEIPDHCLRKIEEAGPAIYDYFTAANRLMWEVDWIPPLVEKRYHPNYRRLNDAQPDALPWNPRPDIVPDRNWNPRFVELDLTVGGRSDSALMAQVFGMQDHHTTLRLYAEALQRRSLGTPLVCLTAYHPAYADLGDDARCFTSMLRECGANVELINDEDLPYLSYRDGRLGCVRPGHVFEFTHFDRFIDIFEIAEVCHAGMDCLLRAYLDGIAVDVNTCKQFLDEKMWMALLWDKRLEKDWLRHMPGERFELLREVVPFTALVAEGVLLPMDGKWVPIEQLPDIPTAERCFVTKESGTSETAAAAQSLKVLNEMDADEVEEHLDTLIHEGPVSVIQELVDSARINFNAIDPETGERMDRQNARVKMSVFYIDGALGDILFVASNKEVAVHNEDYMETIVARP